VETIGKREPSPLIAVGEDIGNARVSRQMSTRDVSQITRIPERYVKAVEAGDFASLPGKPYVFGFTRTICGVLDLDADTYISILKSELYDFCSSEPGI
jgi:cytoskeletal protein RodZ